jgi:hypothetical protein
MSRIDYVDLIHLSRHFNVMSRNTMSKNSHRFWIAIAVCGVLGIVFGGATSQAAIDQCTQSDNSSASCNVRDPWIIRLENMGIGLFAGVGAAVGATWQAGQKE